MAKFKDTKYVATIDSLVEATKDKLNNPYYIFADKKPTKVTYFAQNIEKSTLDPASGLYEKSVGDGSPFKFNKIEDFILYGIERVTTDYDIGDRGLEASNIDGEAIVLPNTVIPRPGDYFYIDYVSEKKIFWVTASTPDTMDTGANIYKINYELKSIDISEIEKQIERSYHFITTTSGTDFKTIIEDNDYNLINELEALVEQLIVYFENIFFDKRLQTFVFNHDGWHMYDPFMIEFFIRNKVLSFGKGYIFVDHATFTDKTFGMDYSRTFFNSLENPSLQPRINTMATADQIQDPNSLFLTRMELYYKIRYNDTTPYKTRFETIDPDVIEHIRANKLYEKGNKKEIYNLWIAYFNKDQEIIRGDIIKMIRDAEYMDSMHWFYTLAITIFIVEQYITNLMKK